MNIHKYLYKVVNIFLLMSYSTRYFQLTPEILVEYNYNECHTNSVTTDIALEENNPKDTTSYIVNNNYCSTKTFLMNSDKEHFVLPVNKSESKFIQCFDGTNFASGVNDVSPVSTSLGNEDLDDDIYMDTFKLHFTSRNYFGDYDGIIISVTVYDKKKNKVGLLSYYIKRTEDQQINENPILINQKLYTTTSVDFKIPNISSVLKSDIEPIKTGKPGEDILRKALFTAYDIMDNTPIIFNIYGVKSTYENNYEYYTTEKINSIYIPVVDKTNNVEIVVREAEDGDYFVIYPEVDGGTTSFSDYLYTLSNERPEIYIVFHELTLIEHYTPTYSTDPVDDITHHEQYIINVGKQNVVDEQHLVNEEDLDDEMYFRPTLRHSGRDISFTINVKTHIINTLDNTTIIKEGSCNYTSENPGQNPKKYGKRMNKIYLGDVPAQVNVYNKKPDIDIDGVKITNASSNVKIENHQHSIIGFIECANVGVSIEQIPTELLS